jgi:hypothetical protein
MSRTSRLIPALVFACVLAACGEAGNSPVGPDGPSLDSGVGSPGGNRDGDQPVTAEADTVVIPVTGVGSAGGN